MGMGRSHLKDLKRANESDGGACFSNSPQQIAADLMRSTNTSNRMKWIMVGLGAAALAGLAALIVKWIVDGGDQASWGYVAALLSYVVSISTAGPIIYLASIFGKGYWGRALSRASLLFVFGGVVSVLLLIPLTAELPSLLADDGIRRRSIWFEAPQYSPHFWGITGMLVLVVGGIALFYLTALPDLVMMRHNSTGWRQRWARRLSRGWVGSSTQWRSLKALSTSLAVIYLLSASFVHLSISADYNMSLVPGWRDAIYPLYHIVTAAQLGLAGTILALYLARRYMALHGYVGTDHFWLLGRFMLAATLGWFYMFFSGFIVYWYGRSGADVSTIELVVVGPFLWAFIITCVFAFVLPWWWLIWNPIRRSIYGPVLGAISIVIGLFFDRLRLFVPAWSVPPEEINERFLSHVPAVSGPSVLDVLIIIGALAGVLALMLMVTRFLPIVPLWSMLEYRLLVRPVRYLRTHGVLIAKPD